MSKFVKISTQLRDLTLIKKALEDLKLDYKENAVYTHLFSGFVGKVPLVVQQRGASFGLRETEGGSYELIGDDMQLAVIRPLMARLQQRYAYHSVLQETAKAGFDLVEESTGHDQVIRLTVRRWS
ncbi:MAG TPA: DUF1257 domain-containing protein [Caldilineaceae bacterium]|nr:DUF1257 domain-containing protein [Caldilineaceae bacterium]